MINLLANLDAHIETIPVESLPDLLGQLEWLKGRAWARLLRTAASRPQTTSSEEDLLTLPQVAQRLNIPESRAYELARRHKLPAVRIGKYVRVRLAKLHEYEKSLPRL
jgi:excisionase family DNA binding protein